MTKHWHTAMAAALVAGCAGGSTPVVVTPGPMDPAVEAEAIEETSLDQPLELVFGWNLSERQARFTGRGVARIEGDRARVDLFGPRGEGYLSAVLLDRELILPRGLEFVPLPPPDLFWSVLGIFRPPPDVDLAGAQGDSASRKLEYRTGEDRWVFQLEDGRLVEAEWTGAEEGRRTVRLEGYHERGVPEKATYRDWRAFVELNLTLQQVREVNGFPNDIWTIAR